MHLRYWRPTCLLFLLTLPVFAQVTPYNGVYDERDNYYAFTGATVHVSPNQTVENATLVIRDGKIVSVRPGGSVPGGAVAVALDGKHVFPSFIEPYGDYGMPEVPSSGSRSWNAPPQLESETEGAYAWNQALRPETDAAELFSVDAKEAKALRAAGFGLISTHHHDGISRGSAALVSLGEQSDNEALLQRAVAHHLSFDKGSSGQNYPNSIMGVMALLRQTYLDADWYARQQNPSPRNLSLEAWRELQDVPQIFAVGDWQYALRADKLGDEFGKQYVIRGSGDEYQRLDALKATEATFIIPLKFPDTYDVSDPYAADLISIGQLRHWERAPSNVAALDSAGIPFVLTADGLEKPTDLHEAMRKAIAAGASRERVFAGLTTGPAELLGIADRAGILEEGMLANFIVTDKDIFAAKATIYQNWVQGHPFELEELPSPALATGYDLNLGGNTFRGEVSSESGKQKMKITATGDTSSQEVTLRESGGVLTLRFRAKEDDGFYRINATPDDEGGYTGSGIGPQGQRVNFRATPSSAESRPEADSADDGADAAPKPYASRLTYPNLAYGLTEMPSAERVLFKNATVWTNEEVGILENTDILIEDGKIVEVGRDLRERGARVIDATGMHLTSGVIDEHSHIALTAVNESSQASTAEVRMQDAVDAVDINIFRQLAGGVTVSQLLHGSANPIGGQSAIVKLRWGATPSEMLLEGADPFIKFALGENVKQSNWGDANRIRYPQTRMGVEQIMDSYFHRAREYGRERAAGGEDFRRDLELETLLEILESERFITCHSYQQGEINMLMKLAERHDFSVAIFTHILEGYKVADIMAEHGAAGSTFSDWWAYKFEVNEAIPYNGALMHEEGVLTAFNSDDAEMARRLNQEAAKAVLFGGVSEEEAWKFVTLNPAKMLHIDDRVGSIRPGKDADLVVWNDHPMSIYARAEHTFIDGKEYFNRADYERRRRDLLAERNALIQASLDDKNNGGKTQPARGKARRLLHCDTVQE